MESASRFRASPPPLIAAAIRPLQRFFGLEAAGGILLLAAAVVAIAWANSPLASGYRALHDLPLSIGVGALGARFTVHTFVNDALMTIFFLVVGLEMKRELVRGELRGLSRAALPAIAALGGMAAPAAFFLALTAGEERRGWGIPMATDIAFAIGCLSLLRSRVPNALVVFVTALAIFDDLGGILVIALFYGHADSGGALGWLGLFAAVAGVGFALGRMRLRSPLAFVTIGVLLWYALHRAGIHPTMAGVTLGLLVPATPHRDPAGVLDELAASARELAERSDEEEVVQGELDAVGQGLGDAGAPVDRLISRFHGFVAFFVMPVFALVNAGVDLRGIALEALWAPVTLGVGLGLFVGKQAGVFLVTLASVRAKLASMPGAASTPKLYGVSLITGIGFTVALFIADLAYAGAPKLLGEAKVGILAGSAISALAGVAVLRATRPLAT